MTTIEQAALFLALPILLLEALHIIRGGVG